LDAAETLVKETALSNELPKLEKAVSTAEQVIASLQGKRAAAAARAADIAAARKQLGFAVHAGGDKDARAQLAKLNLEDATLAGEMQSLDGALAEAGHRLQAAQQTLARERERDSALALRGTLKELTAAGKEADAALFALIKASDRLRDVTNKIHGHGVHNPSHEQIFTFGCRAINTALMKTIWSRGYEVMAPNERIGFGDVISKWVANLDAGTTHRLAVLDGEQKVGGGLMLDWRDFEMVPAEPQSEFARIFGKRREYVVRKATYRGGSGHRLHHIENLTREEALHWLAHDPHGRSFARERSEPLDVLADHPVENKEESMDKHFDVVRFAKRVVDDGVSAVSEEQATELIKQYANANRLPNEKPAAAFARIYSSDDDVGLNFRKMVQIAKGIAHPHVGA
jgi:hypothetical protein